MCFISGYYISGKPSDIYSTHSYSMHIQGKAMDTQYKSIGIHAYPKQVHGNPRILRANPCQSMDTPCRSMGIHGYCSEVHVNPCIFHVNQWKPMQRHANRHVDLAHRNLDFNHNFEFGSQQFEWWSQQSVWIRLPSSESM